MMSFMPFIKKKAPSVPTSSKIYKWIVFAISVLFVFYKYILEVSPSIMTRQLMTEFNIDAAIVGHIAASYYYAYTLMQIPGGLLVDAFGPRYTTTVGLLCCTLGAFLFGLSQTPLLMACSRFLIGMGATFAILNTFKINSNWFPPRQFALLAGLTLTLGTLGAVFGQAPLSKLITHAGWRQSFFYVAIFGLIFSFFFFLIVRDQPHNQAQLGKPLKKDKIKLSVALLHMIKQKQTWILSTYSGLCFAPMLSFAGLWGVSFIEAKYHLHRTNASFLTSLVFIGFAIGAPCFGWYSSFIKKRKPVMFWGTLSAFTLLTLAIYLPPIPLFLYGIMQFFIGFSISAFLLSFSVIHEINLPLMTATAIALMNTFNALVGAFTDPLIGFFLDLTEKVALQSGIPIFSLNDYLLSFSILPTYLLICLILLKFVQETNCIQKTEEEK